MRELQQELRRRGLPSDRVGMDGDRSINPDDGVWWVRRLGRGRWETYLSSRGKESDSALYDSEAEAVSAIAEQVLFDPPVRVMTPEEREAGYEQMRAAQKVALERIDEHERRKHST